MEEIFFQCPYCWQEISMLMDPSIPDQNYVEDCEVCCNPIEINPVFQENELIELNIRALDL
ncbi:MAG: CPXCG motif-containing cysteine-rich protein [Lutimonas sp.]|jgi:hypothetical protein